MGLLGKSSGGPSIGIDIGSSLIKIVEARPGKDGIEITALGVVPTPPGSIENEIISDPQAIGQAIKQLLSESGISCKRSVSSVSGQSSVIVRIIEVPKMTTQELAETMKWEIERHVPFAANEVVMDFLPVERPTSSPDDENMEVLLAVAQEAVINSHVETLFAAGLEPTAIDVECLAASRSLIDISGNGAGAGEGTIAVVNVGSATTEMAVYRDGLLAFPRTLPIAGDSITRALSDGLNITMAQAERLKRERAAVLMDRSSMFIGGGDMDDLMQPMDDMGGSSATVGFMAPSVEDNQDSDFGFIPGLGYTGAPEAEQPAATSSSLPDFDIDISGSSSDSGPAIDFDMSSDADMLEPVSEPKLELSSDDNIDSQTSPDDTPSAEEVSEVELMDFAPEVVFDSMGPVLADLVAEIRRSLEYYASRYQTQPGKIMLCGGTAKLKDLDKLIEADLGIPVEIGNPLQNLVVLSKSLSEGYLEEVATIFPVGIGLAIRDMIGE